MWALFTFVVAACLGDLEKEAQLYRASLISETYAAQVSKALPPSPDVQTLACLERASIWYFSSKVPSKPSEWDDLRDFGIQALALPYVETNAAQAKMRGMTLIGRGSTRLPLAGPDFQLALRGYKEYPQLFHMVEVDRDSWSLLPRGAGPIPMESLQELRKRQILEGTPEIIYPNSSRSCWDATNPITGCDGKARRWIYLRQENAPAINWLDPTFASLRLTGGTITDALFGRDQSMILFECGPVLCRGIQGFLPSKEALSSLAMLTRKLGGFSALKMEASLADLLSVGSDLWFDRFTAPALQHAMMCENAASLRHIYQAFLEQGVQPRSFIHELYMDPVAIVESGEFSRESKSKFLTDRGILPPPPCKEESLPSELLAERLLKEDKERLTQTPSIYTPQPSPLFCNEVPLFPLAFFYAMQPGVFAFYELDPAPSLQLKKPSSFASQLKALFQVRKELHLASAELIDVLPVQHKGLILLLHRLNDGNFSLTAFNCSKSSLSETIQHPLLIGKWVINAENHFAEPKTFEENQFALHLDGFTGKIFLFQSKYYE